MSQIWKIWSLYQGLPIYKVKYKEYLKSSGDKGKREDRVPERFNQNDAINQVAKQPLVAWGNSYSELEASDKPEDVSMLVDD